MHDIKLIRKNPDIFVKKLADRNIKFDLKNLLDLDEENRKLIQKKEKLEQEKKIISKKRMSLNLVDLKKFHLKLKF